MSIIEKVLNKINPDKNRRLEKVNLLSYNEARAYIKQVHSCWGGGQIDDDLINDCKDAYIKGFINQREYDQLLKIINPKKYEF